MSCLVEQPPYCDLLRLSPATRRFVRFRRACLRAWGWLIQFACVLEGKRGGFFFNLVSKYLWIVLFGPLLSQLCTRVRFPPRAINYWIMLVQSGQIARWPHTVVTERTEHFCLVNEAFGGWVILHGLSIPSQNISKCLPHTLNSLFKVNCLYG